MGTPLYRWRTKVAKISRKECADLLGCSESMIYRMELPYGDPEGRIPSPELAFKIEEITAGKIKAKDIRTPREAMNQAV